MRTQDAPHHAGQAHAGGLSSHPELQGLHQPRAGRWEPVASRALRVASQPAAGAGTWARCQHRASASLPFVREPRCTPQTKLDVRLHSAVGELLLEREVPRSLLNTLLPRLKVNYCRAATLSLRSINIWIQTERAGNLTKNGSG